MMIASKYNTGGSSKFFQLCVSGILRLWFYISVRTPEAWGNSILSSPIQAISQSLVQTINVLPDVQSFHRVESTVTICEPTSFPHTSRQLHTAHSVVAEEESGGYNRVSQALHTRSAVNLTRAAMEATGLNVSMFTRHPWAHLLKGRSLMLKSLEWRLNTFRLLKSRRVSSSMDLTQSTVV